MTRVDTWVDRIEAGTGGLSVGSDGTVYSADFGAILSDNETMGTRVWKISAEGEPSVFADGFKGASGSEFDANGNLFQSNIRGNCITKITPDGSTSIFADEGLNLPVGITFDKSGAMYVANCGGTTISRFTSDGTSTVFIDSDLLVCPNGLTFDDDRNLYVANFDNGDVVKITPDAKASRLATIPGNNNGHITYHDGALYVVARSAHQVYRVSLDGEVSAFAGTGEKGSRDGVANEAQFCYPNDIKLSNDGRCFYVNEIADTTSDGISLTPTRVRRIWLG